MRFGGQIGELSGDLPMLEFGWDPNTEILSGKMVDEAVGRGYTGSIEFEDERGAVLTLDVESGLVRGLEIVVWPVTRVREDLVAPQPDRTGQLEVSARPSQPGIAVLEIEVPITACKKGDGSVIHLQVGEFVAKDRIQVADKLMLELDRFGDLAGFWLIDVPPCPLPD